MRISDWSSDVCSSDLSQLRQIDRVEEEVWDPVHCLPKIEKVKQPRIATRNSVRALPQRQETVLAELSPRLRSKDAADECLRFLDRVTRGCCKIKSSVSSTLVACERIQHRRKHLTASDKVIVWVQDRKSTRLNSSH